MKTRRVAILVLVLVVIGGGALWLGRDFKARLGAALANADRLEVVAQRHADPEGEAPVTFVLKGREKVLGLLDTLDFEFSLGWSSCRCLGDTALEFFDGDTKLATLTFHHGTHLRWPGGHWGTDIYLRPQSQVQLTDWFREQGYDRLHSMRQERLADEKRESDETTKFYSFFPGSRIDSSAGKPKELAKAVFRAFSATSLSWSTTGEKEREAIEALSGIADADLLAALPEIQDDKEALLGFARFFFFNDYDEKMPEAEREEWAIRLARMVLTEGLDDDKPQVMRYLWSVKKPAAGALFHAIASGELEVRPYEGYRATSEPSPRAGAALSLAVRGDGSIKDQIEALLEAIPSAIDRAALETALAVLGEPRYLKKEHFTYWSGTLGFAGLRAIELFNGAHGMDALIDGAFQHPWAAVREDAVVLFERITGHIVWNRASNSRSSWYINDAVAWWKQHGEQFVKQRREALMIAPPAPVGTGK